MDREVYLVSKIETKNPMSASRGSTERMTSVISHPRTNAARGSSSSGVEFHCFKGVPGRGRAWCDVIQLKPDEARRACMGIGVLAVVRARLGRGQGGRLINAGTGSNLLAAVRVQRMN